jgi:hypothetical protein
MEGTGVNGRWGIETLASIASKIQGLQIGTIASPGGSGAATSAMFSQFPSGRHRCLKNRNRTAPRR